MAIENIFCPKLEDQQQPPTSSPSRHTLFGTATAVLKLLITPFQQQQQ